MGDGVIAVSTQQQPKSCLCGMKQRQVSSTNRLGEPQLITDSIRSTRVTEPEAVRTRVREGLATVGRLLEDEEEAALLSDVHCSDTPIMGVSKGFTTLTGFSADQMIGKNCRILLTGVPEVAISKSVRKNLRDFCRMCRMDHLEQISEVTSLQPNARADGSQFMNFFYVGLVKINRQDFLLGIQKSVGEGLFVKLSGGLLEQVTEEARASFKKLRNRLVSAFESPPRSLKMGTKGPPGFTFFAERLQDHCILLHEGRTAIRREPQELATNCLVFGNSPCRRTAQGLFFALRVNDAVPTFEGLPTIGFTRRRPTDSPDLYPAVCRCLGASVLVGACGEAFARDQWEHFKIGFKQPPQDQVASWSTHPNLPAHKRRPPCTVQQGDILGCLYTVSGHLQLWRNGVCILDFDVGRPLDEDAEYYAVVDVCLSVYSVTLLPFTSPTEGLAKGSSAQKQSCKSGPDAGAGEPAPTAAAPRGKESSPEVTNVDLRAPSMENLDNLDAMLTDIVNYALVKKAVRAVVGDCQFCVTVADPRGKDIPLIAVSEAFESMTGYKRSEILGVNCRFLNQGCPISPMDLMGLRVASEVGCAFTALLPNRKKSGEMFVNLLDLRGLTIAKHLETGEELWYLIGIQADVTGLAASRIPEDHLAELQEISRMVRNTLKRELSMLAAHGAEYFVRQSTVSVEPRGDVTSLAWKLLEEPTWTSGSLTSLDTEVLHSGHVSGRCHEEVPRSHQVTSKPERLAITGSLQFGLVIMSAVAFASGLLIGRCTRRC